MIQIREYIDEDGKSSFASWFNDLDGNRVELWQPPQP